MRHFRGLCFDVFGVVHSSGIKRLWDQCDCIGWGSPEGEDPTLGSHVDEFTNYEHLAQAVQPSAMKTISKTLFEKYL